MAAVVVVPLAGCAVVDKYADRAVDYNLQAEKTQQQNLLLNIIRASLRRPMQFTGLSSISGNATATGSATGGYTNAHQTPWLALFGITPTPSSTSTAISRTVTSTAGGTASLSGGQTFTVPVLDTQEFYSGILSTLTPQIIDYYVQQGFPPQVLFDLFISSIDVTVVETREKKDKKDEKGEKDKKNKTAKACTQFTFRNSVRERFRFEQFQTFADYLIASGFTTERVTDLIPYGPHLASAPKRLSAADSAKLVEAYSQAVGAGLEVKSDKTGFRMHKKNSHYRFCFAYTGAGQDAPGWLGIDTTLYCNYYKPKLPDSIQDKAEDNCVAGEQAGVPGEASTSFSGIKLSNAFLDRMDSLQKSHPGDKFPTDLFRRKNTKVRFKLHTRSVEGIMYYLGEVMRQYLTPEYPDTDPSRITQVKTGVRYGNFPRTNCDFMENDGKRYTKHDLVSVSNGRPRSGSYTCENLFVLETGQDPDPIYSVSYDGVTYSVPRDPARHGRTLQVLELVKQLLALHTSAKQLPQSGVISIIGGTAQ